MYKPLERQVTAEFQIGNRAYKASFPVADAEAARRLTVSDLRAAAQNIIRAEGEKALIAQAVEVYVEDPASSTGIRLTELSGQDPIVSPDRQTVGSFILRLAPFVAFTISEK